MPKKKTSQSIAKRFRITAGGKIKKRTCGQDHYNSRESGKTGRGKKSDITVSGTLKRIIVGNL